MVRISATTCPKSAFARYSLASSSYLFSAAIIIPIKSSYRPPALFSFNISTALSLCPRLSRISAMLPHRTHSFIFGSVFCEINILLFSYNSNALFRRAFSRISIPNTIYKTALLYTTSKLLGYFFKDFSASVSPSLFFSCR